VPALRGLFPGVREAPYDRFNPIDPADTTDRAWLEARVWPEGSRRLTRLRRALDIVLSTPIDLVAGDTLTTLPDVLSSLPRGEPVVILNSSPSTGSGETRSNGSRRWSRRRGPVGRFIGCHSSSTTDAALLSVDGGDGPLLLGEEHHWEWLELYARP
jgi:hypothetical protein